MCVTPTDRQIFRSIVPRVIWLPTRIHFPFHSSLFLFHAPLSPLSVSLAPPRSRTHPFALSHHPLFHHLAFLFLFSPRLILLPTRRYKGSPTLTFKSLYTRVNKEKGPWISPLERCFFSLRVYLSIKRSLLFGILCLYMFFIFNINFRWCVNYFILDLIINGRFF